MRLGIISVAATLCIDVASTLIWSCEPAKSTSFDFTTFDAPAGTYTQIYGINDFGLMVGNFSTTHGFLYNNGTYTPISVPGATQGTEAFGINNAGQVVGVHEANFITQGFVYSNGTFNSLSVPGTNETTAFGTNNAGQIVGDFYKGSSYHGFVYSGGAFTTLDAPGATQGTYIYGINDLGQMVGGYNDANGLFHSFLLSGGIYTDLAAPGTHAFGINNAGQIVGWDFNPDGSASGFLDSSGIFTSIDFPGASSTEAFGINNEGQIVGQYFDAAGGHGFLATPAVPEPSTWAMMLLGFAGIGFMAYRRKSKPVLMAA